MLPEEERPLCGNCIFFDINDVLKQPFGFVTIGGVAVKEGVCRIRNGLIFGTLNEKSRCLQPPGVYTPKDSLTTP